MRNLILTLLIPIIVFSQSSKQDCENTILQEALVNSDVNQYFQIALSLNIDALSFIDDCDSDTNYTMFLPGNSVPNESAALLLGLPGELMDYIPYYIYQEPISFIDFTSEELEMMDGNTTYITVNQYIDQLNIMINEANITTQDICTCNGTIHIIDDLIWAPGVINVQEQINELKIKHTSNNQLTISNIKTNSYLEITNIQGQKIFKKKSSSIEEKIDLSHYKTGIYVINIGSEKNRFSKLIFIH